MQYAGTQNQTQAKRPNSGRDNRGPSRYTNGKNHLRGMNYADGAQALSPRNGNPLSPKNNSLSPVQCKESGTPQQDVHVAATLGVQNAGSSLPHLNKIQAAFGRHDVTSVKTQVGGVAKDAGQAIGATAYAMGNNVAFTASPDLHTAAHEAAHIIQQRAGVSLSGGVGKAGDQYEKHADAVADLVVSGKSAESELDKMVGGVATAAEHVQSRNVQRLPADPTLVPKRRPSQRESAAIDQRQHLKSLENGQTKDPPNKWGIKIGISGGAGHAGLGVAFCVGKLKNFKTGQIKTCQFIGGGIGLGASTPGGSPYSWSEWTEFRTPGQKSRFEDFNNTVAKLDIINVGLLVTGSTIALLSFPMLEVPSLFVGGSNMGSIGFDASSNVGVWNVNGI